MMLRALPNSAASSRLLLFSANDTTTASLSSIRRWIGHSPSSGLLTATLPSHKTSQRGVSSILSDIWDSILRAVPKKKTSHMKKRHRQMAGKALKDVKNFSTCSGCGQIKRAHVLCPHCVTDIKEQWQKALREQK